MKQMPPAHSVQPEGMMMVVLAGELMCHVEHSYRHTHRNLLDQTLVGDSSHILAGW